MEEKAQKANRELGELISHLKKEKSLTLEQIASKSGLSISQISDIIHGKREPTLSTLQKISDSLEMSFPQFLTKWTAYIVADMRVSSTKLADIEKSLHEAYLKKTNENSLRQKSFDEQIAFVNSKIEQM